MDTIRYFSKGNETRQVAFDPDRLKPFVTVNILKWEGWEEITPEEAIKRIQGEQ